MPNLEIARLDEEIERVARAHDEARRGGEDRTPYKVRLNDVRARREALRLQLRDAGSRCGF